MRNPVTSATASSSSEHQRREMCAGSQSVAAGPAGCGVHGVAQLSEAVDVAADRPLCDPEALGEFSGGPLPPVLQRREQAEHPLGWIP